MNEHTPLNDIAPIMAILSKISFLGGVSDEQREVVFRHLEARHYSSGDDIARKGETPTHIYIIRHGTVRLELACDGACIQKREFHVGDCFGEAALLSMINNTASFVAADDCELLALSWQQLNQLRVNHPDLFCILIMNIARELARKLQYTDEMLLERGPSFDL